MPFVYLPEEFDEARFLGPYQSPGRIDDASLTASEDVKSLAGAIYHAKVLDPDELERLASVLKGDEGYARLVGQIFLDRFKLNDRGKFFSSHRGSLNRILRRNRDLREEDFYLTRENRPFLIVVGTLLSPAKERFLLEATPLYVGVRNEFVARSEKDRDSGRLLVGGGYVEALGYDSYEPDRSASGGGLLNVRLKGRLSRGDPPVNKRYRFTLSDVIGMSSAAPHVRLADKGVKNIVFPEFRHWAIDRERVARDDTLPVRAKELKHGDGGDIDNLALLPLLARKVQNILVFINTRAPFSKDANCDQITTDTLVDDLVSLFRPTSKLPDNVVFANAEAQLARVCEVFLARKNAGSPLVYCQRYEIQANRRQAVRADGYEPSICWVYLDRSERSR